MATYGIDVVANTERETDATLGDKGRTTVYYSSKSLKGTQDDIVTIKTGNINYTINTGDGNDTIYGARDTRNAINGGSGHDWIEGGNLADNLIGGEGNDVIYSGAGDDVLFGECGHDFLSGNVGSDAIYGGGGNDMIYGGQGDDNMWGDAGNDGFAYALNNAEKAIDFGNAWGNDTIHDFETGKDRIGIDSFFMRISDVDVRTILAAIDNAVTVDPRTGKFLLANQKALEETLFLGASAWTGSQGVSNNEGLKSEKIYTVNGLDNKIYNVTITTVLKDGHVTLSMAFQTVTDDGNGHYSAFGTRSTITFKNVDDLKSSDFNLDTLKLIHGKDVAGEKGDVLDLGDATHKAALGSKGAMVLGFDGDDKITGTATQDQIYGGKGKDTLYGSQGNDIVRGDEGDDKLFGDHGNDDLRGGDGDDTIYGDDRVLAPRGGKEMLFSLGAGNDVIYGNGGTNHLWGGRGADVFGVGGSGLTYDGKGLAVYNLERGLNYLEDFKTSEGDKMRLGDLFADYRISNKAEQDKKFSDFLDSHITHGKNAGEVFVHTNTKEDFSNGFVIKTGSEAAANALMEDMHANYAKYFVYG